MHTGAPLSPQPASCHPGQARPPKPATVSGVSNRVGTDWSFPLSGETVGPSQPSPPRPPARKPRLPHVVTEIELLCAAERKRELSSGCILELAEKNIWERKRTSETNIPLCRLLFSLHVAKNDNNKGVPKSTITLQNLLFMGQNREALLSSDLLFLQQKQPAGCRGLEAAAGSQPKDLRLSTPLFQAERSGQEPSSTWFSLWPPGPCRSLSEASPGTDVPRRARTSPS